MESYYPPLNPMPNVPVGEHYAAFGVARKYSHHCGVDLHCPEGSRVFAIESGTVVEGDTGVVVYGELFQGSTNLQLGAPVSRGEYVGGVKRVLRHDKGKPLSMLHFMLLKHGFKDGDIPSWTLGESKPDGLLDPTALLVQCSINYVLSTTWR